MRAARDFTGGYVRRVVDTELDELFPLLPAILLDGPKGVGKAATARQPARTVRRLGEAAVVVAGPNVIADDVGPDLVGMVVATTGPEAYRRQDGVAVIPLGALGV